MKNIHNKILKNNFVKGVLVITSGTATAQLLNILLSPVISRIYSPEEYGILTVYSAVLGVLVIVSSLKYESGVAIADNDEIAINVMALSGIVLVTFVVAITLILTFWGEAFLELFSGTILLKYKIFIPLGIFFTGLYSIFTQWALRKKNYNSLSKTKISQSIVQNIIKISFGLLQFGPTGLILGSLFGQSAGIMTLSASLRKKDKYLLKRINKKNIYWCAKRYIRFPLFSAPSQFLNTVGLQLPIVFMSSLYGSKVIGYYGLANVVVNLPMDLIGRSVSDVFYGEAASIGRTNPKRLEELSIRLFKKLILIGLFPLITLILFGPFLFSFVFGQVWYEAGVYSRIIAFLVFTRLIFTPISRVFSIYERQKDELFLDFFRVIMILIVFGMAKLLSLNSYWFVGLYTLGMSIVYLVTFLWVKKIINDEVKKEMV